MKTCLLLLAAVLLACASDDVPVPGPVPVEATCAAPETLRWKRVGPLASDLARALSFASPLEMCRELESDDNACVDVHRVLLGGSDPFGATVYEAPSSPLVTTAAVTERLVLSACAARADRDAAGEAAVFPGLDGGGPADVEAIVGTLHRRLLARDPSEEEGAALAPLAEGTSARDFAVLACFAVGTSAEFLLF
jgi:hypothetical protein